MASTVLFFSPRAKLYKDEDLFSSPPMTKLEMKSKELFSESPEKDFDTTQTQRSPLQFHDDDSRDSGIFCSDQSDSGSPVSEKETLINGELSFRSFFRSPDSTPEAAGFLKTRRILFGSLEEDSSFVLGKKDEDSSSILGKLEEDSSSVWGKLEENTPAISVSPEFELDSTIRPTTFCQPPLSVFGISRTLETKTPESRRKRGVKRKLCVQGDISITSVRPAKKAKADPEEAQDSVKEALEKECSNEDLVGDFSHRYRLPTVTGKHQDLRSVSPTTVADLISGNSQYRAKFQIVDCRYPYEFAGGHIQGALNLHTQQQIADFLEKKFNERTSRDTVLIFHCEFSSERAPKRARFLRSQDRQINAENYPRLCFPEIYILNGGYNSFYGQYASLCKPQGYTQMLKTEHREDLRKFRSKSKSWAAGGKPGPNYSRSQLSRCQLTY